MDSITLSRQWSGKRSQVVHKCLWHLLLSCLSFIVPVKKKKESQLHGQAPHSQRPGAQPAHLELRENKTDIYLSFGLLTTYNLVSSPIVERKTRSLTVDEVKSSRERTPEYCTNSNSGWCCGGICAKKKETNIKKKTEVRRWTLSAILVRQFLLPQNEGGSQNNVQPLVSPWSWDYTLLLPEDTGAVWWSFSHTC